MAMNRCSSYQLKKNELKGTPIFKMQKKERKKIYFEMGQKPAFAAMHGPHSQSTLDTMVQMR